MIDKRTKTSSPAFQRCEGKLSALATAASRVAAASALLFGLSACTLDPSNFLPDPVDAGDVLDPLDIYGDLGDVAADATDTRVFPDLGPSDVGEDTTADTSGDARFDIFTDSDVVEDAGGPQLRPIVTGAWPDSGPTTGGTLVVIDGRDFTSDVDVFFGGVRADFVDFVDPYQLWVDTPAHDAGTVTIKLVQRGGSALIVDAFSYVAPLRINAVDPLEGPSTGGLDVTVHGAGFNTDTHFVFAWTASSTSGCSSDGAREAGQVQWISDSEVLIQLPPGPPDCTADIIAYDDRLARLDNAFTFVRGPRIEALVPNIGDVLGGESVRVVGVGIDDTCSILIDNEFAPLSRDEDGWLVATTPGGAPGLVDIAVDCAGRGSSRLDDGFRYRVPGDLRVESFSPPIGFVSGGNVHAVTGLALNQTTSITIGGADAAILNTSARRVDVLVPALDAGYHDLVVGFDDGSQESLLDAYQAVRTPVFDELVPNAGATSGWTAELTGTGLGSVQAIFVDGTQQDLQLRTDAAVRFDVQAGSPGDARLDVRAAGILFQDVARIRYEQEFGVARFFPDNASTGGGTPLYVVGTGFDDDCQVALDGITMPTQRRGTTILTAIAPAHDEGRVSVSVLGCGGDWTSNERLLYVDPSRYPGGVQGGVIDGEVRVSVRDISTFAPVENATVVLGVRNDSQYVDVTGVNGSVTFADEGLRGPVTVTAFAEGRSVESVHSVDASEITLMLYPLPVPPCEDPTDPECQPTPPPVVPLGELFGNLTGMNKIIDFPPGTTATARIETSRLSPGYTNPFPGTENVLAENGPYRLDSRLGTLSLIALCGYTYDDTGDFVPLRMGIVRNISLRPETPATRVDVDCNIPLNQQVNIKLTSALPLTTGPLAYPTQYTARLIFDLGSDGAFDALPAFSTIVAPLVGGAFPALEGPLDGVRFDVEAGAYPDRGTLPRARVYARNASSYDGLIVMPGMLSPPRIVIPDEEEPVLTDGYIEWETEPGREPDMYHITVSSSNAAFHTWSVYVPGWQNSFNITDFPSCLPPACETPIPTPGDATGSISFYIRAIDNDIFDYNDFDRYVFRSSSWRASAADYYTFQLPDPNAEPEPETVP